MKITDYLHRFDKAFTRNAIEAIHTALTAIPLWFTINLLTFKSFSSDNIAFAWWAAHGSQHYWACWTFSLFICGMVGLVFHNRWLRVTSATILGVGHACVAAGFYMAVPAAPGIGTYVIIAILAVWRIYLTQEC